MTQDFMKSVMDGHRQTLDEAAFYYQVTFADTKYCHRYINFEVDVE